jgi:GT2 family glycosyltransferase
VRVGVFDKSNQSCQEYDFVSNERLERAIDELRKEEQRVERLREDYRILSRSRFFALRMLWLSAKAALGGTAARNTFITSSMLDSRPTVAEGAQSDVSAEEVISLWRERAPATRSGAVMVSVVVPVFNQLNHTLRCLRSLAQTWPATLSVEVILIDDASTDDSATVLSEIPGLSVLRNLQNVGFVRSCNSGAQRATGKYICFLNNDTVVGNAWLDHLVSTAERDPCIGAVGAKLIYPNGTLQEAGAIIWADGTGWNYGRHGDPRDSRYNYERDVDYCSGAALLVRRDAFDEAGGFSDTFAPAYYEDVDLCFTLRARGFRVVYQPHAEVVHYEGVTSGTSLTAGVKRQQELNRPKFAAKWQAQLTQHFENNSANVEMAARRLCNKPSVLMIDSYVPLHDKEAGSNRLMQIIRILRRSGIGVVFLPDNYAALQPYTDQLQELGVEVLHHSENGRSLEAALEESLSLADFVWICRPDLYEKYAAMVRRHSHVKVIYDTVDLHFIRKQREFAVLGTGADEASQYERIELCAARSADATVVVSEVEGDILRQHGVGRVHVIPTIHDAAIQSTPNFEQSSGIVFIGNYNHSPNADAAEWLARKIMPMVWKCLPRVKLALLGSNPTKEIRALASRRIEVPGYVPDVERYFRKARVFAAPLRFGAGVKGKVGQAMAFGVPMVLTDVAAEGFGLRSEHDCIVANDANQFARSIVRLYEDFDAWTRISRNSLTALESFSSDAVQHKVLRLFDSLSAARV